MFAGLFCRSFLDVSFAGLLIYFLRFFCRSLLQVYVVGLLVFFVGLLCRSLFIYVGLFWHLMMFGGTTNRSTLGSVGGFCCRSLFLYVGLSSYV